MIRVAMLSRWHVHADDYARDINESGRARVTAIWDEQPARGAAWAEELGVDWQPDLDALLARTDIDAVCVVTPTNLHRDVIIAAATAGKHIFTEKVLAASVHDAEAIAAAVGDSGVHFTISFPRRCIPGALYLKQAIDAGSLGQVTQLRIRIAHDGATAGWLPEHFFSEREAQGGAMLDLGAHGMYLSHWLLGRPVRVTSLFSRMTGHELEDNAVSLIEFDSGTLAINETSLVSGSGFYSLEADGTSGSVRMLSPDSGVEVRGKGFGARDWQVVSKLPAPLPMPITQWLDAIDGGPASAFGMPEALALTEMMEAAYASAREHRTVRFDDD